MEERLGLSGMTEGEASVEKRRGDFAQDAVGEAELSERRSVAEGDDIVEELGGEGGLSERESGRADPSEEGRAPHLAKR
jgi:hypothetical protein